MTDTPIIECVPNFSEGRRPEILAALTSRIDSIPKVQVLASEMDPDHNRSVITMIGEPDSISEAIVDASKLAISTIDMNLHSGVHPRIGAIDVIPLIPVSGITFDQSVIMAKSIGARLGSELSLPVYLYAQAASNPNRENLADIRRLEYEGLSKMMSLDTWLPDFGPREPHPTAGAVAVGVRKPLIAFNVNLNTKDVSVATQIAREIRERDGGFKCLKALGLYLNNQKVSQVSMNFTDYGVTTISDVFDYIKRRTEEEGIEVIDSELVGLINMQPVLDVSKHYLKLRNMTPDRILESHIHKL
ncbi:MAG: glutamate formimidoyltransferase [Gemmatimonadota bacterium]|nr:glutamate formimidoyltransferase [Gemmatimonadota bacterium]